MTFFRDFEKRRQTMTRLIDADNLKKAINTWDEFACLPNGKLEPFRNLEHPEMFEPYVHLRDILNAINNAPTVELFCSYLSDGEVKQPCVEAPCNHERPQGEWMKLSNMSKRSYRRVCSQCHNISYFCGDGNYPNCPYCLADMREVDNEDSN